MKSRFAFVVVRIIALCLAAASGYVAVYIPLMNLLFDKRQPASFLLILGLSLAAAGKFAQFADRRLPRRLPSH